MNLKVSDVHENVVFVFGNVTTCGVPSTAKANLAEAFPVALRFPTCRSALVRSLLL